jgi:murein DD-endopeptidase MepM/ murein hydrolase activator NlpD
MRLRVIATFFAGFACGLVFLALLLWQSGKLGTVRASTTTGSPPPVLKAAPLPLAETPNPAAGNQANPVLKERKLIVPVQGIDAQELRDDFNEMRGGHRHEAIDIMAPRGTPVLAADEGNVAKLFLSKPGGLTVYQFDDTRTYCYYYAHLDKYAPNLKEGVLLRKGDVLGYVGSSGDASPAAPHLHFTIFKLGPEQRWWQGTPIDPYPFLAVRPAG